MIYLIHHKVIHAENTRKLIEENLLGSYEVNFDYFRCDFGNTLYTFLTNTKNRETITLHKNSLLDYFKGFDTETYHKLYDILDGIEDEDLIEISTEW